MARSERYEVWIDDEHAIECETLDEALVYAGRGPCPVTERLPIGDERILLVEDLASRWLNGEAYDVPHDIVVAARKAMKSSGGANA